MKFLACFILSFAILGCTSAPTIFNPETGIDDTILVFRENVVGPNYGNCRKFGEDGKCSEFVIKNYDLSEPLNRELLRAADFVCLIGNKRYLFHPSEPGIFHRTFDYKTFLGIVVKKIPIDEFIHQSESAKLAKLGTVCFSESVFSEDDL